MHSVARLECREINEKRLGGSACSLYFSAFQLGYFACPLDYPERGLLAVRVHDIRTPIFLLYTFVPNPNNLNQLNLNEGLRA